MVLCNGGAQKITYNCKIGPKIDVELIALEKMRRKVVVGEFVSEGLKSDLSAFSKLMSFFSEPYLVDRSEFFHFIFG